VHDDPADIRHLPDVRLALAAEAARIRIELHLEELDPPVGTARAGDGTDAAFTGWLGLLEAVSGLVARSAPGPGNEGAPPARG
jgi:hypothetical protein